MKILITGGTGFLGSHLARRLDAGGHAVTVLRRASSNTNALDDVNVRHEIGDLGDALSVRRAIDGQDVVVHAAAGATGSGARLESYEINVAGTRSVVDACFAARVKRLDRPTPQRLRDAGRRIRVRGAVFEPRPQGQPRRDDHDDCGHRGGRVLG
jgi:UDP-glucose 4-epimerase